VAGFAFDIDSEPPPGAEIQVFLTTATMGTQANAASWGGATTSWSPVHAGHNEFTWKDVGGPWYLANPPPFDESKLIQIGFQLPSNTTHAVSYRFCIKNLTALLD
jgi:hypothetical protein